MMDSGQNLGVMIAGGNGKRHAEDFYATPPEATVALIQAAQQYIGPVVDEPACGDGRIAKVLVEHGYTVRATDLVDRGYGRGGVDFLQRPLLAPSVITNPPFKHAAAFIEHACGQQPEFLALLLKATFWHAAKRFDLYERFTPKLTLPLTWRLDFTGGGSPTMDCTWFCWGSAIPRALPPQPLRFPGVYEKKNDTDIFA